MSFEMPQVPRGSGEHPIVLVVVTANNLAASSTFYAKMFGWQVQPFSPELAGVIAPGGPPAALRCNVPAGFPGMVPYIGVGDVDAMLSRVVAAGATVERAAWSLPGIGKLARFKDPTGTIYGLTDALPPGGLEHVPMPLGPNPKPPAGAICSIEMHVGDEVAAPRFFGELFGWGTLATMPQYVAFDPGAGVGGVFQSHTSTLPAVAYIYTTDVEAKLADIAAAGGKPIGEPARMPGAGCFGYFQDPSGTSMGLIGP
jgi:predicted enzyme related to lactoylglutathione lyase